MNDAYQALFPEAGGFSEADYLAFLSQRVPECVDEQLTRDAHPDLMLDDFVSVSDLMRPLSSRSFLADRVPRSTAAFRLVGILEYTLVGYELKIERNANRDDPYKHIYVASFYLRSCMQGDVSSDVYVAALLVLVEAAAQIDIEGRLQVSRFIGSLIPVLPHARVADPAPLSTALIALSLVTVSMVSDISSITEIAMREEGFAQAWRKEEEDAGDEGHPILEAMTALRQSVVTSFGASGKVEQIANRFREALDLRCDQE
jgi:hypothetical protein